MRIALVLAVLASCKDTQPKPAAAAPATLTAEMVAAEMTAFLGTFCACKPRDTACAEPPIARLVRVFEGKQLTPEVLERIKPYEPALDACFKKVMPGEPYRGPLEAPDPIMPTRRP